MRVMKDSGVEWIGEIPAEWEICKIGNIYEERNIKVNDREYIPLSVTKNGVVLQLENAAKSDNSDNRKLVKINDFVINSRSDRKGSCGISKFEGSCSLINIVLKPKKHIINQYYNFLFKSELFAEEFYKWGNGIVDDLWSTKWISMKKIYVPAPSFREQQRIADYLDKKCAEIDAIISKQHSIIEKLKEYKLSLITETVTKGLNADAEMKDSGIEWIGEIPKHWDLCKLKHIGYLQNGISKGGEYFGYGYPFVSYGDVYKNISLPFTVEGLIDSTEEERFKYSVQEGDIFFTRTSETIEEVGFSAVCEKTIPEATFAGFLIRVRPYNDKIKKEYAKYYFRSNHHRVYLVKEMNLVTRASLGQNLLKNMIVLLPPKEKQYKIADFLNRKCAGLEKIISDKLKLIIKLTEYKKSLIYEVVTGKKEV